MEGTLFGHKDFVDSQVYLSSARCITEKATTLRITANDFKMLYHEMYSFKCFIQHLTRKVDNREATLFKKKVRNVKELRVAKEDLTRHIEKHVEQAQSDYPDKQSSLF